MRIWVAAGGTGGHLYPALAVVEELQRHVPGVEVRFAVSRRGLEERVLDEAGWTFHRLVTEGLHRREVVRNLLFPLRTIGGFMQSLGVLLKWRPQVAFGTGGFISGPALLAARLLGIPVALLALDAFPGATIRLLAPRSRIVFIAHEDARPHLSRRPEVICTGIPVRRVRRLDRSEARTRLGIRTTGRLLLVTGGSQGSATLNRATREGLGHLLGIPELAILWQTGDPHYEAITAELAGIAAAVGARADGRLRVVPYIEGMADAWSAADLALCRAGASTLAELAGYGVPALLIPLPTAAGGHQEANARAFAEAGAGRLIHDAHLDGVRLATEVAALLAGNGTLEDMSSAAASLAETGAAARVAAGLVRIARRLSSAERNELLATFGEARS